MPAQTIPGTNNPPTPRPRGRGGWSLVESVLVMGVLAWLLAMVLPVLGEVRRRVEQTQCQTHLHELGRVMALYALDWRGWHPPGPVEVAQWPGDPDRGSPNELYDVQRPGQGLSGEDGWYGMGLLWKKRLLSRGQGFYCPSAGTAGGLRFEQAWPRRFDEAGNPADGKTRVYATYVYRGGLSSQANRSAGPLNLHRDEGRAGLLADDPLFSRMWHDGGYNVARLDGRVDFHALPQSPVRNGGLPVFWTTLDADPGD